MIDSNENLVINNDNVNDIPFCFWDEITTGKTTRLIIKTVLLYEYLKECGFAYTLLKKDKPSERTLIRVVNNIVEETHISAVRKFIADEIKKLPDPVMTIHTKAELLDLYNNEIDKHITQSRMDTNLETIEVEPLRDNETTAYFYYKNGFVEVTKNAAKFLPYSQLKGKIWKHQIIKRNIDVFDLHDIDVMKVLDQFEFCQFLKNTCTDPTTMQIDIDRLTTLRCVIGYYLHRYKLEYKAVIWTEAVVSDKSNGRSGKSLIYDAIATIRNVLAIDLSSYKFNTQFAMQEISKDIDVVFFDEAQKTFGLNVVYNMITGGIAVEEKGKKPYRLSKEETPKIAIASNYGVQGNSGSDLGRKYEMELLPYYNHNHTPIDDFKRRFFDHWGEYEWNVFDNLMFFNTMIYLSYATRENSYKIPAYESETINQKKLLAATDETFIDFFDNYINVNGEINTSEISTQNVLNSYIEYSGDTKMSSQRLIKSIQAYADSRNLEYIKTTFRLSGKQQRGFKLILNKKNEKIKK